MLGDSLNISFKMTPRYVPIKPSFMLHGHKSPIVHIHVNVPKENIISIAENKEIRVHDFNTQSCIQAFYRK